MGKFKICDSKCCCRKEVKTTIMKNTPIRQHQTKQAPGLKQPADQKQAIYDKLIPPLLRIPGASANE